MNCPKCNEAITFENDNQLCLKCGEPFSEEFKLELSKLQKFSEEEKSVLSRPHIGKEASPNISNTQIPPIVRLILGGIFVLSGLSGIILLIFIKVKEMMNPGSSPSMDKEGWITIILVSSAMLLLGIITIYPSVKKIRSGVSVWSGFSSYISRGIISTVFVVLTVIVVAALRQC